MNMIIAELPQTIPTAHFVSSEGCECRPNYLYFTPPATANLASAMD